jgi:hypothetical protein
MMKMIITISCIVVLAVTVFFLLKAPPAPRLPAHAFLVGVRACDAEDAWVMPFKVTTDRGGTIVPIQEVAFSHFTLSTFCQWTDWTTRTVRVEAEGYEPREFTVSGKTNIIAVLYQRR